MIWKPCKSTDWAFRPGLAVYPDLSRLSGLVQVKNGRETKSTKHPFLNQEFFKSNNFLNQDSPGIPLFLVKSPNDKKKLF